MADIILIIILVCIVGSIVRYLYKAKKRGETCIGCSCGKQCSVQCSGCSEKKEKDS